MEGQLRPRLFLGDRVAIRDLMDPQASPTVLWENDDAVVSVSRRSQPMPFYFRNADGDEVHFIHRGRGRYETDYGPLGYGPGDYLWIPKGTTCRVVPEHADSFTLIVEAREFVLPDRGLMGQHAFIDPAMLETPEPDPQREAQRLPYYHRNIDYDELLFYHAGEFMSRHGIGPGAFTLHPQGIHHGPHPKAFESARARDATNEVAVLVETTRPLRLTAEAEKAEDPAYATNWAQ